jgi:hypothetical protein
MYWIDRSLNGQSEIINHGKKDRKKRISASDAEGRQGRDGETTGRQVCSKRRT